MGLIAEDIIRQVMDRSDIVEVIGRYIALKKAGTNFKALCPFHHEKSPSFVVNPDKQIFHCFGCHVGGNAVSFVMRQERLDFPQAIRFLAEQAGIEIPENEGASGGVSRNVKDEIIKANELAMMFYQENLLTNRDDLGKNAREYLKNRGIDLETVKTFNLGLAPLEWDGLIGVLKQKGISLEVMQQAGLVIAREKGGYYDRFRGRIIFPIFDIYSHPVAFGARAMGPTEGAKYINSPETPVYTKGRHVFGLNLTKTSIGEMDHVVVVEGYMDMIMPFVHGVKNIAASCGTALTVDQIRLIRRYSSNVIMLFDTDPAGQAAMIRSLDVLVDEDMNVKVAKLTPGDDPDSFIRHSGLAAFQMRLQEAQSLFDYKFDWLAGQSNPTTIEGKSKICQDMLATISRFKSEVVKFELMRLLAQKLQLPEEVVRRQANVQLKSSPQPVLKAISPKPSFPKPVIKPQAHEEILIGLFLDDHGWVTKARERITSEDFVSEIARQAAGRIWILDESDPHWTTHQLLALLPDTGVQSFIAGLMAAEKSRAIDPHKLFEDCISFMQQKELDQKKQEFRRQIKEAEQQGDLNRIEALSSDYQKLLKSRPIDKE